MKIEEKRRFSAKHRFNHPPGIKFHFYGKFQYSDPFIDFPGRFCGVMGQKQLFPMVRAETKRLLNGYLAGLEDFDALIVPPDCYPDSGLMGALLLAQGAAGQ